MSGSHGEPATRLRILDLLCYNKLPIVVLAFSAGLEKPFKQDNLSVSRHRGAQTKHRDKGAV